MRTPVWNKAPLTCPMCGNHFAMLTIRIVRVDNAWVCHGCALKAVGTPAPTHQAMTLEQHRNLPNERCATCHQPFANKRSVVNIHGSVVHYRCPQKAHPNRRNRQRTRAG